MSITSDDLNAFHHFAAARLASRSAESLHELVDLWEIEHPAREVHAENVAAVQAAIRDMKNGDRGRPAGEAVEELRDVADLLDIEFTISCRQNGQIAPSLDEVRSLLSAFKGSLADRISQERDER